MMNRTTAGFFSYLPVNIYGNVIVVSFGISSASIDIGTPIRSDYFAKIVLR